MLFDVAEFTISQGQLITQILFSIIIETLNLVQEMHTKLSMKNLHTFGQQSRDNPFTKQSSISSKSRNQSELSSQHISNPFLRTNIKQKTGGIQKSQNQYQNSVLKDTTNMHKPISRPNSNMKEEYQSVLKTSNSKHGYSSVSPFKPINAQIQRKYSDIKLHNYSCDQIMHLLKHEQQSIQRVKHTIQSDKNKIQGHFDDFKQSINNVIDDLKLSICNNIDSQYQYFVNQFRTVKLEYTNYSNVKKQFWLMKQGEIEKAEKNARCGQQPKFPGMINSNGKIQNQVLLMGVIEDLKDYKKHVNYKQFEEVQQRLLKPLLLTTKNMIKQMNIQSYYKPQIAYTAFKHIHRQVQKQMNKMHERMDLFISDYLKDKQQYQRQLQKSKQKYINKEQALTQRYKSPQFNNKPKQLKHNNNICSPRQYEINQVQSRKQGQIYLTKKNSAPLTQNCYECQKQQIVANNALCRTNKQKYSSTAHSQFSTGDNFKKNSLDQINESPLLEHHNGYGTFAKYNEAEHKEQQRNKVQFNNEKLMKNKYRQRWSAEDGNIFNQPKQIIKLESVKPIIDKNYNKNSTQSQTALCVSYLASSNTIGVGTKGGTVKLFCTKTGAKLDQLRGHKAGVCALSTLITDTSKNMNLMASGSDVGCCQVIVWDMITGGVYHAFNGHHQAAISSIIDIGDGKHIMSGGFDSIINIYNFKKKQLRKSVNTNDKITVLTKVSLASSNKLQEYILSGHLNNQICVWTISKNSFNSILGLESVRKINIGTVPYSIAWMGKHAMVAGKDSWVRAVDIIKGSIQKAVQINSCQQVIPLKTDPSAKQSQMLCIGGKKDGTLISISSANAHGHGHGQQLKQQYEICRVNGMVFSCGISPTTSIGYHQQVLGSSGSGYGHMYRVNHNNKHETQVRVWAIRLDGGSSSGRDEDDIIARTY